MLTEKEEEVLQHVSIASQKFEVSLIRDIVPSPLVIWIVLS